MRLTHCLVLLPPACALLLSCAVLSACVSHGVRCDGRLQPINPPHAGVETPPRTP